MSAIQRLFGTATRCGKIVFGALVWSLAAPFARAHGEHGPGGHHGWELDHFDIARWSAVDWGIAAGVALAAVIALRYLRRKPARRRSRQR